MKFSKCLVPVVIFLFAGSCHAAPGEFSFTIGVRYILSEGRSLYFRDLLGDDMFRFAFSVLESRLIST